MLLADHPVGVITCSVSTKGLYTRCYGEAADLENLGNFSKFSISTEMSHLGRSVTLMYSTKVFLAGRLVLLFTHSVYPVDLCARRIGGSSAILLWSS